MDPITPHLANSPARPTEPPEPPAPPLTRLRRIIRRLVILAIVLVIIGAIVFFLLPMWISGDQGRNYMLSRFNKKITGTVRVESWKMGWFSDTEIHNLTLSLPDGKTVLTCPRIQSEMTLWSLLTGTYDLGNTRLEAPTIMAAKYADGSTDFSRLLKPPAGGSGANALQTLSGYIVCNNGVLELSGPGGSTPILISNISAEMPIASSTAPIHMHASGLLAGAAASELVDLTADLPGPAVWTDNPCHLLSHLQLRAGNVPTATFMEWLNCDPRWEQSFGTVLTSLTLSSEPIDAEVSTASISLAGKEGSLQAKFRMTVREDAAGSHVVLELLDQRSPSLFTRLRVSPPAADLLAHVNPVFANIASMDDAIEAGSNELAIDLLKPQTATGLLRVRLPALMLRPAGLLGAAVNAINPPAGLAPLPATVNPLTLRLGGGHTACADLVLTLAPTRQRLTFAGSIGFDSSVNLLLSATVSRPFGSDAMQIPITGTISAPVLKSRP